MPHEYAALVPEAQLPSAIQHARSITLCTEQPGTPWFDLSAAYAAAGAAVDISAAGKLELLRGGIRAERFRLGYAECWDAYGGQEGTERDVDVVFMGSSTPRRQALLAANVTPLARQRCRILLAPERPTPQARSDYLVDDQKRALLSRSSVILNIHRGELRYFEWGGRSRPSAPER